MYYGQIDRQRVFKTSFTKTKFQIQLFTFTFMCLFAKINDV